MAAKLGYKSVSQWLDDTTEGERIEMLAVAWLDGWGEEWQELAAVVNNMMVASADAIKTPEDMRRFKHIEGALPSKETDWNAVDAMFRQAILKR